MPICAACRKVSSMCARSSSRYITATLAPTNRNGLRSITNRRPFVCTKPARPRGIERRQLAIAKKTAAPAIKVDAASRSCFLAMNPGTNDLPRAGQTDKSHDGASSGKNCKQVKEAQNGKAELNISQDESKAEQ